MSAAATIRERPILFSAPLVRAILNGTKTMTRRLVKPQPPTVEAVREKSGSGYHIFWDDRCDCFRVAGPVWAVRDLMGREPEWRCKLGLPRERLWVREAFDWVAGSTQKSGEPAKRFNITLYRATADGPPPTGKWTPSIHMPRWASRITLEIVSLGIERLQAISEEDAKSEGVEYDASKEDGAPLPRFHKLWDKLNPNNPWESNPWVWRIAFRRIEP